MTLILALSKPEGVYMSTDYRLTRGGRTIDDESPKFMTIKHVPHPDGPTALLGYTGLAEVRHLKLGMHDWLRMTIRGEPETFDQSMAHLLERLNRDISRYPEALAVNFMVVHQAQRFTGGLVKQPGRRNPFQYSCIEITDRAAVFWNGSGSEAIQADARLRERLLSQRFTAPEEPFEQMRVLAEANRRVAQLTSGVSPHCHVAFLHAEDEKKSSSRVFAQEGESVPFHMKFILFGIDAGWMSEEHMERSLPFLREETDTVPEGPPLTDDDFKRLP